MTFIHFPFTASRLNPTFAPLAPIRRWMNTIEVGNVLVAQMICHLVPNTCSSAHEIRFFDRTWFTVPSICQVNPFKDELIDLRFRAADFLYEYRHG